MKELFTITCNKKENEVNFPLRVLIKKPGAKDLRLIRSIIAAEFSKCLSQGILPSSELIRINFSDDLKSKLVNLEASHRDSQNEFLKLSLKQSDTKEILEKIETLRQEIASINSSLTSILEYSADTIAFEKALDWCVVNFCFWEQDKLPVFKGETDEAKINSYYDSVDEGTVEYLVFNKARVFIQAHLNSAAQYSTEEAFKKLEEDFDALVDEPV